MKLSFAQIGVILTFVVGVILLALLVLSKGNDIESKYREAVDVFAIARDLGLNEDKFKQDIDSAAVQNIVKESEADVVARLNGQKATPTVYIDGEKVNLSTVESFIPALQEKIDLKKTNAPVSSAGALVSVEVFSDYNCPHCAQFDPIVEQAKTEFGSQVEFIQRHLPFLRNSSWTYSYAAEAARVQGKFDAFHVELFKRIHGSI